ncbi:MAG TPA: hypothetical protein VHU40_20500, partial [Polyangia bacterium]|nr:hypothetical protein [Polyangia bacterium]
MSRVRLAAATVAALFVLVLGRGAAAQTSAPKVARVTVIGGPKDGTAAARIAAELRAFGFVCQLRTVDAALDAGEAERAFRGGARAVVQLDGRAGRTQVSIAEPAAKPSPSATTPPSRTTLEGATGAIDPVLIVRTVELVRAALLRPVAASVPAPSPSPAAPAAPAAVPVAPASIPPAAAVPVPATEPAVNAPPSGAAPSPAPSPAPAPAETPTARSSPPPAPTTTTSVGGAPPGPPARVPEPGRWRASLSGGVAAASGGL